MDDNYWTVAYTRAQREVAAVAEAIRSGHEAYCPLQRCEVRYDRGKTVTKTIAMFPRYIFVKPGAAGWANLAGTRDIEHFLHGAGDQCKATRPIYIPIELIEGLRARGIPFRKLRYRPGEEVRIHHGSFADFIATVQEHELPNSVVIHINLLGSVQKATISVDKIEKVGYNKRDENVAAALSAVLPQHSKK